jgi:hypothetical protein
MRITGRGIRGELELEVNFIDSAEVHSVLREDPDTCIVED